MPYSMLAVILLTAAGTQPSTSSAQTTPVPQWSVHELTLTAAGSYADPYTEVDLVGVFSGPSGQAVVVPGFWDGDHTFKVRFTPEVEGVWTYMTVSSDAGLDGKTGTLTCIGAQPGTHGFIRRDAAHPPRWVLDDGTVSASPVTQVGALDRVMHCPTGDCVPLGGTDHDDARLAALRAADVAIQSALAKGDVAELALFGSGDTPPDAEAQRFTSYAIARYAAYPNVVWCLPAPSDATAGAWSAARSLVQTTDPYFARGLALRVLLSECSVVTSTQPPTVSSAAAGAARSR